MPRLLFAKTGNAVWMSHLDLMRLFQRAFKRAGLNLKHTQGFTPRPMVSIALPMSVGVESCCELLDFDLEGDTVPCDGILDRLNPALVEGVEVLQVYEDGRKIKDIAYLSCTLELTYDGGVPSEAIERIQNLFARECLTVEKHGKNGMQEQDIIPKIKSISLSQPDENTLMIRALVCCQNPSLNPMQIPAAISRYLPEYRPNFVKCARQEIYDAQEQIFR